MIENMIFFDPENPFLDWHTSDSDTIRRFFEVESHHRPPQEYSSMTSNIVFRAEAVNLIKKYGESFDHVVPYLAVTYFDLFYSSHPLPQKLDEWAENVRLLATSCFVSAWKMRNYMNDNNFDFLNIHELEFTKTDIRDMETLVDGFLNTSKCKRPVTALTFLDFFIGKLPEVEIRKHKESVTHKLYELQYDVRFIEFKPSVLAAVALIQTASRIFKKKVKYFYDTLISCEHVDSENLERAINLEMPSQNSLLLTPIPELDEESGMEEPNPEKEEPNNLDSILTQFDELMKYDSSSPERPASEEGDFESSKLKRKKDDCTDECSSSEQKRMKGDDSN